MLAASRANSASRSRFCTHKRQNNAVLEAEQAVLGDTIAPHR
jgi:hypothetical protein